MRRVSRGSEDVLRVFDAGHDACFAGILQRFENVSRVTRVRVIYARVSQHAQHPAHTPAVTSHDDRFAALRMDSHKRQSVTTYVSYTFANESFRGRNAW
jgi:hypothetical protein